MKQPPSNLYILSNSSYYIPKDNSTISKLHLNPHSHLREKERERKRELFTE